MVVDKLLLDIDKDRISISQYRQKKIIVKFFFGDILSLDNIEFLAFLIVCDPWKR